ncbi:MAG: DUF177 domain-containing protein [Defluviicoccus sp.]|nr:MAG: DUF177 domain-containing protein [Defluviicoccus sp.]
MRLDGRLQAEVVQVCVITLEPMANRIDVPLQRLYGSEAGEEWDEGAGAEMFLDLSADLLTEPLDGDSLDLGAAAAEQLALELDPIRAPRARCSRDLGLQRRKAVMMAWRSSPTGGRGQAAQGKRLPETANLYK